MRRRRVRDIKVKWNPQRKLYEPVLLERHVVTEIVERLWLQAKVKVWVINQPVAGKTPQNAVGLADLWGWVPKSMAGGQYPRAIPLLIEVKRPGGVRRPAQERFIQEARDSGCVAFFAESWMDVVREMAMVGIHLAL